MKHIMFHGILRVFILLTSATMSLMVCALAHLVGMAIASPQDNPIPTIDDTQSRRNVNKNFELNIKDRRILEQDYKASTSISLGEFSSRGLSLRIGAGVRASEVDIRLHNIQGKVHFHASGERLVESDRSRNDGN
jgi:hypothetical protein